MTHDEYIKLINEVGIYASYEELKDMTYQEGVEYLDNVPIWVPMYEMR